MSRPPERSRRRLLGRSAAALAALALVGCGWHAGLLAPAGAETLGLRFLGNDTRLPGFEVDVTQAIGRAVRDRVSLRTAAPERADLVLEGEVFELRRWAGVRSPENEQLEASVQIGVELRLIERKTGEILATSRRDLRAGYVIDPGFGIANTPGQVTAQNRAISNLAEGLVLDLFRPLNRQVTTGGEDVSVEDGRVSTEVGAPQ